MAGWSLDHCREVAELVNAVDNNFCDKIKNVKNITMKKLSITGSGLSTMCRLCLSCDVALLDIFRFSIKMKNSAADVITKCAPVQVSFNLFKEYGLRFL